MQGQWRGDVPPYITSNFLSYTRHTRGRGFDPRQCLKLIRNSNLPSFGINCHKSRNLSFKFRQKLFYCKNCNLCTLLSTLLDLFFIFDTFNIATHSNSDATREASNMDIVSTVVGINGILRWKSHQQRCTPTKDSLPLWEEPGDEHYTTMRKCSIDC